MHLKNLKKEYQKHCPIKLETIANHIIEHCLFYFLRGDCPIITLTDGESSFTLNEIYSEILVGKEIRESFVVRGVEFEIVHLKLRSSGNVHKIYYCAKGRVVKDEKVQTKIPNLVNRIEEDETSYLYQGYVFGKYLDNHVNSTRTELTMPQEDQMECINELSFGELSSSVIEMVKKHLSKYLEKVNEEKKERIREYVQNTAVEYRSILKHNPEMLEAIPPDVSDEALEIEFHKAKTTLEIETKDEVRKILSEKPQTISDLEVYTKKVNETLKKVTYLGQAELSIIHST